LKEDAEEFLDQDKLKALIQKYSEFINFPIYLHTKKTVNKEVPVEEEEETTEEAPVEDAEVAVEEDEEEAKDTKPKTKTVSETVFDWELVNETKPIWTRSPKEVSEEDYAKFYKTFSKEESGEALTHSHFTAEGDVDFTALLYVPTTAPFGMFEGRMNVASRVRLYVRRVFITDKFEDLIPKYLAFLTGVVDSDDLPLNVSREMLQQHKMLKLIQKKLVRKAIAMFQALEKDDAEKYKIFYETYGTNIKLGCIEDVSNKHRLSKLLRFSTNKHRDEAISLEKYVEEMKKKQKDIYYLGGESKESLIGSPYLERLARKGYDVLFLTDPIDEYVVQTLQKFDNKYKFVDVSKEGLKLDEDEEELKKFQEEYKPLTEFLKKELDTKVIEKVSVSTRLTQTPCALVSASYGYSANMERILKAQALSDKRYKQMLNQGRKTLEINPKHPIIKELLQLVKDEREDKAREAGKVLYETAVVSSGFSLEDPTAYAARVLKVLGDSLDIDPAAYEQLREELANSAAPEEEPEDETPEETTPEEPVIPEFVQENDKDEL
jgi:heat shock protein beta